MPVEPRGYYEKRFGGGKFSKNGLPDMHICIRGMSIECELKAPNGRPSELQLFMINQINTSGGMAMVVYPRDFDDFKEIVNSILRT
jgi:hypothetical protein